MRRVAPLVVLAACGGNAAAPAAEPVAHTAPVIAPAEVVRIAAGAEARACPPERVPTTIDACLRGVVRGEDVVFMYTMVTDPEDDGRWGVRRLVIGAGGAVIAEGPESEGDALVDGATISALVDLDADGTHEVVELDWWGPARQYTTVWSVASGAWVELLRFMSAEGDEGEPANCTASWRVRDGALVVDSSGDAEEQLRGPGAPECLAKGEHAFRLVGDALVAVE